MRALLVVALLLGASLGAIPVAGAAAPAMRADPFRAEAAAGSQFRGFLTIENPNDYAQDYALTVNTQGLTVLLDAQTAALEGGTSTKVGFLVIVPTTMAPREALLRFDASDSGVSAQAFVIVNVTAAAPRYDAGILPATGQSGIGGSIEDGNTVDGQVHVTNQNSTRQTVPIRVRDVDGWTSELSTEELDLAPGQTDVVFVRFTPSASARNGTAFLEIGGGPSAHTSVVVSLNITHTNASAVGGSARLALFTSIEELTLDFASESTIELTVRNDGTAPFSGPVGATANGVFTIDGPTSVSVGAGEETTLVFRIATKAEATPDERGYVTWRIGEATGGLPLRIASHLRVGGDLLDVTRAHDEPIWLNLTVWNDGEIDWTGEPFLDVPFGLAVSSSGPLTVPAGSSVTRQYGIATSMGHLDAVDGEVRFGFPGGQSWTLKVHFDAAVASGLAIALEPGVLALAEGEGQLVDVRVENRGAERWSGLITFAASPGVDVGAAAAPLAIDAGATVVVPVYVTLANGTRGSVEFRAAEAASTLFVNPANAAPEVETAGEATLALVAVPLAGVALAAGTLAVAPRRWPLAFAGLYARLARSRLLEHPTRARIRELVEGEPGLTHNEIGRRLELERGTLDHHLAKLVRSGLLVSVPDGQMRRHYAPGGAQPATRAALDARILAQVRERAGPTPASEVASALGVSRQAMHYHLRRMVREGSIVAQRGAGGLLLSAP